LGSYHMHQRFQLERVSYGHSGKSFGSYGAEHLATATFVQAPNWRRKNFEFEPPEKSYFGG